MGCLEARPRPISGLGFKVWVCRKSGGGEEERPATVALEPVVDTILVEHVEAREPTA